jgi:Trypsin
VAAGKENAAFRYRTFPKSATQITAQELLNLAPKIDIPNAKPIKQRASSKQYFNNKKIHPKKIKTASNSGILSNGIEKQIIGGADATLGQYPWQVYIYIDNAYLCGGSLILQNFVMTAGHCSVGYLNSDLEKFTKFPTNL